MRKFMGSLKAPSRKDSRSGTTDTPDDNIKRDVRNFIDSKANPATGDEVLHLPRIVEACESSPTAAASAAYTIRKSLKNTEFPHAYKQYNALMLLRILIDNPGTCKHVAKNIDSKFVEHLRVVLRTHIDPSVQQITRETLDHFATAKAGDHDLQECINMWLREKGTVNPAAQGQRRALQRSGDQAAWVTAPQAQRTHSNGRRAHQLPNPAELAGRIEEAKMSAKLLIQLVQSTPPAEFGTNELIPEFSDRCQTAQRSLQGYMNCTDPAPDEATFQTLIETCEQLSLASSKHQRAALAARRQNSDVVQRAEGLYNSAGVNGEGEQAGRAGDRRQSRPTGKERENSMNGVQPTTDQQRRPAPTPPSQLNDLAPVTKHGSPVSPQDDTTGTDRFSPIDGGNPFADHHRVSVVSSSDPPARGFVAPSSSPPKPYPSQRYYNQPQQQPGQAELSSSNYENRRSPHMHQGSGFTAELPGSSSPPLQTSGGYSPTTVNGERVLHLDSPRASTTHTPHLSVGNTGGTGDLYSTLGVLDHDREQARPGTAESDDLYSVDHHAPPPRGLGVNGGGPTWGEAETPRKDQFEPGAGVAGTMVGGGGGGQGRVKDDEPFSPVGGVSGSGWGY